MHFRNNYVGIIKASSIVSMAKREGYWEVGQAVTRKTGNLSVSTFRTQRVGSKRGAFLFFRKMAHDAELFAEAENKVFLSNLPDSTKARQSREMRLEYFESYRDKAEEVNAAIGRARQMEKRYLAKVAVSLGSIALAFVLSEPAAIIATLATGTAFAYKIGNDAAVVSCRKTEVKDFLQSIAMAKRDEQVDSAMEMAVSPSGKLIEKQI